MGFESWGIVEIMGHKVYAGKLSEQEIAGTAMLRVDVPETDGIPEYTKLFGSAAIYAITPTDEAGAKVAATRLRERPVSPFVLPALQAVNEQVEIGIVDYPDEDDFDDDDDEGLDWFDDEIIGEDDGEPDDLPVDAGVVVPEPPEPTLDDVRADIARSNGADWAYAVLNNFSDLRVLDCEATGIESGSEPVSIAVIDKAGDVLLDTLVKPSMPIPAGATAIHGIDDAAVANAPTFADVWPKLIEALGGCDANNTDHPKEFWPVVIYNVAFDTRVLRESAEKIDKRLPLYNFQCAMEEYAYLRGGRWQKLTVACAQMGVDGIEDKAHSAVGDCQRTLALVKKMAEKSERHKEKVAELPF